MAPRHLWLKDQVWVNPERPAAGRSVLALVLLWRVVACGSLPVGGASALEAQIRLFSREAI